MRIKYTPEMLTEVVEQCSSVSEVLRKLGIREAGGNHTHINRKIKEYGIDTSHFAKPTDFLRPGCNKRKWQDVLILRTDGRREQADRLRRAMLESGMEYKCVSCPIHNEYNGKPIVLEVNHKNGNWSDNRPDNVEFRCPNCHSQYHGQVAKRYTHQT